MSPKNSKKTKNSKTRTQSGLKPHTPRTNQNSHYFSKQPQVDLKINKHFLSIQNHTFSIQTASGMFSPEGIDSGTQILVENLIIPQKEHLVLLDIGAGYGPISLWLSKELDQKLVSQKFTLNNLREEHQKDNQPIISSFQIYASEVNERASWLLKRNIHDNEAKNIEILGDFLELEPEFQSKNLVFDAIYTNPPLKTGHETMLKIFELAAKFLNPDGFIQYVHKKKLGAEGFMNKLQNLLPSWHFSVIRKKSGYHIIVASPQPKQFETTTRRYSYY